VIDVDAGIDDTRNHCAAWGRRRRQ
jgi:hypothetical protein